MTRHEKMPDDQLTLISNEKQIPLYNFTVMRSLRQGFRARVVAKFVVRLEYIDDAEEMF